MLQFIYGKPASGKTYTVLQKIKEAVNSGKNCVLIVPEQFTFESERAVLHTVGDNAALNVEVLSFTRLCDEVGRKVGGIAGRTLSECDKVIFMKKAMDSVKNELKLWSRYADSVSFSKTMLDSIGEFKINSVTADELRAIAESSDKPTLKAKLSDIALLYETYDAMISEKFIDPTDLLTRLYRQLENFNYFENKTVFIDSFKGFTGQQYKIMERILCQSKDLYVTFTYDIENKKEFGVFANIRRTAEYIKRTAENFGITVNAPIILGESRYKNKGLYSLEKIISEKADIKIADDGSVNICAAATPMDEAEFAARTIRRLVREEGYRYRDFVIIARDAQSYKDLVISACRKNDISLFYDNRVPLAGFPLAVAARSAIGALDFSTENILRFHKSGLGTLTYDEISTLENYAFVWNIEGDFWLKEWDMDPDGLNSAAKTTDEESAAFLKEINLLREKAIKPILTFKNRFKNTAYDMAVALIALFDECDATEKLSLIGEAFLDDNNIPMHDALRRSYEEYMKILDSLVVCFGNKNIEKSDFSQALHLAVSLAEIGVIPQTLDEVTFGSADRIRPSRPKVAFILGGVQGVFPKIVSNNGVFNLNERKYLIESGINVSDYSIYSAIDEEYLVYCNLCCASEKLYISYYNQNIAGEKCEPATFVNTLKNSMEYDILREPAPVLCEFCLPETENAAFSEFCRRITDDGKGAASIKDALSETSQKKRIDFLENCFGSAPKSISLDTALKLFGKNIKMSASRFDNFNRCRFSYFCRYGLKAQKLRAADFNAMQRGTLVHFVLERLITEHGDDLQSLTDVELGRLTDEYIGLYLDGITGLKTVMNAKTEFLISRISRSLKDVVRHVAAELKQSDFKPIACELKIGRDNPLSFPYDSGKIMLAGSIDRVDEYNGYIRVIDYKTGSKNFKLPDILFGLNMQMLIYLYAVTRAKGLDDSAAAGILYQPVKRNLNEDNLAMNGLLCADEKLYHAMDKGASGEFVPKLSLNKNGSLSQRGSTYVNKESFTEIFDHIERIMRKTGNAIASGDIAVSPIDGRESPACEYCDYKAVCGIENSEIDRVPDCKTAEVFEKIREGL